MKRLKLLQLVIIVQIAAVFCGILIVFIGDKRCMTSKCKDLESMVKEYVLQDISPCDNFYGFACGRSFKGNESDGLIDRTGTLLLENITDFLENLEERQDHKAFYKAKIAYKQCLQQDPSWSIGVIMFMFVHNCGGFPARDGDEWTKYEDRWDLLESLWSLRVEGLKVDAFFSIRFKRNPTNTSKYLTCISVPTPYNVIQPQTLVMCEESCQKSLIALYSSILVIAGVKNGTEMADAKELLEFDMKIAKLTNKVLPLMPHEYENHTTTVREFIKTYELFDWKTFFKLMIWNRVSRKTLEDEDLIMVESPKYLSEIISLIKNSTKRQLANYIVWYNLVQFNYHPEPTRDSNYCFNTFMALNMPEMLTALAVKTRDESNYKIGNSLMDNIEKEFVNQIKLSTWMKELTKEKALEKVHNLKLTIGFYQSFLDEGALDQFFKALEIGGNFYQTYREIWKFRIRLETDCFKQNLDSKLCRFMDYGELNMFRPNVLYDPLANEILVPDSFLREPVISLSWPKYIHYGRLGFVLGHSLALSVDVKGAHYDQLGRLNYWWDNVTSTNYQQQMKCVDKQVKKLLPLKESTIETLYDRESTIRSVADDAGIVTSFKSYRNGQGWISDLMLPTVDYTKEQLFFIALAHLFCDAQRVPTFPVNFYGIQIPSLVRVNEIVRNTKGFSEAFNCDSESDMNPKLKCSLWNQI